MDYAPQIKVVVARQALPWQQKGSLRRVECGSVHRTTLPNETGFGWEMVRYIMKAFVWRSVWDESNLANSKIKVLNLANDRCPGCDYIISRRPHKHGLYPFGINLIVFEIIRNGEYSYRRGLWRCLFNFDRQCKSLDSWNRQQDDSTLLFAPIYIRTHDNCQSSESKQQKQNKESIEKTKHIPDFVRHHNGGFIKIWFFIDKIA